jgi:FdhD protein
VIPPVENAERSVDLPILTIERNNIQSRTDALAVEEPLEIRIGYGPAENRRVESIAITMRTPGEDIDLALGFLWTEGILSSLQEVTWARHRGTEASVLQIDLHPGVLVDIDRLKRHFYAASSCGVCGKASLEAVRSISRFDLTVDMTAVTPGIIHRLPDALRAAQQTFDRTGGLHAAALFDPMGDLICLREDVGRHNAVDKLIGAQLRAEKLPLTGKILLVSGRASFELAQKAGMAGIPVLAAIGAPSSLAVELAADAGMTLLGFIRETRFNIYTGGERILSSDRSE